MKTHFCICFLAAFTMVVLTASAQNTAFTYQGRLMDNGAPADGNYQFLFRLMDAQTNGTQLSFNQRSAEVSNGVFTVLLDFGARFDGTSRWLDISVSTNWRDFTQILPRQSVTPTPYALHAYSATLTNGAIDTPQLAAGAVTALKLASNSVTGAKIADFAVDTAQLAAGAVTTAKLASNAVTSLKVADGTLLPADLDLDRFNRTFWKVGGNAGTSSEFIGTTDDQPFDIRVNNLRVMRYRLGIDGSGIVTFYTNAPNVIGGSPLNSALATIVGATIAGGGGSHSTGFEYPNRVTANFGTVGGGYGNTASDQQATVNGGHNNTASSMYATVCGGGGNTANGFAACVSGGYANTAFGSSATVSGGNENRAGGYAAIVSGGAYNTAAGSFSFAGGYHAKADHDGSFVWADSNTADFHSSGENQFAVRCTGGARLVTAINGSGGSTAGVWLLPLDNAWRSISDRNAKKNFQAVDAISVLEKLAAIPISRWHYKWESDTNTPHLGPMAQDFKAAFYPGRDDTSISTMEFDGIELAAIQGLNRKLEDALKTRDARIAELEERLKALEQLLSARSNP